jgi:PHD/YefM family antitoxin component YafN of YafNO toxin-antitoxin module
MNIQTLHPNYITNEKGDKTAVIITIDEYNQLIEDLIDLAHVAERRDERFLMKLSLKN